LVERRAHRAHAHASGGAGRQYCERFVDALPVVVLPPPIAFPRMMYYQLWHPRTQHSNAGKWLREQIKTVATALRKSP
jgi:DNA-binding transcriptional LysR family regulator